MYVTGGKLDILLLALLSAFQADVVLGQCTSKNTESCADTKCCTNADLKCYEKDEYWAGCKSSCTPGIDPYDPPKYQTPWSCKLLSKGGNSPSPSPRRRSSPRPSSRRRSSRRRKSRRRSKRRRRGSKRRRSPRRRSSSPRRRIATPAPTPRRRTPGPTPRRRSPGPPSGGGGDSSGKKIKGHLTMWANNDALIGSQCEYANAPVNSITDPMLPKYLRSGFHCAIGDSNPGFGKGEHCGKCYRLESLSDSGTGGTPGKKGSATVMVSNGGAGGAKHFDCIMESFEAITGARTGIFDVTFEEVTCDDIKGGPVVINWADKNAYYCKMMFENIGRWGSLEAVEMCIDGSKCNKLQLFAGATWTGCPGGEGRSTTWKFTQKSPKGGSKTISCTCSGGWPWNTGKRCTCPDNF